MPLFSLVSREDLLAVAACSSFGGNVSFIAAFTSSSFTSFFFTLLVAAATDSPPGESVLLVLPLPPLLPFEFFSVFKSSSSSRADTSVVLKGLFPPLSVAFSLFPSPSRFSSRVIPTTSASSTSDKAEPSNASLLLFSPSSKDANASASSVSSVSRNNCSTSSTSSCNLSISSRSVSLASLP